jgi:hypothetical protein
VRRQGIHRKSSSVGMGVICARTVSARPRIKAIAPNQFLPKSARF